MAAELSKIGDGRRRDSGSIMSRRNGADVVLAAWRSLNAGTRDLLARARPIVCHECLHPIRWWNRRIWLADGDRYAHLRCWKGHLFLKALVANEVRRSQLMADEMRDSQPMGDEVPRPSRRRSQDGDNGSAINGLHQVDSSGTPREAVERLEAQQQNAEGRAAKTRDDEHRLDGGLSLHELGQDLWHFLDRSSLFWNFGLKRIIPHRPPRPQRRCMFCGAVAFSGSSAFCTKCGSSLSR